MICLISGEIFLPQLIVASDAMSAAIKVLEQALPKEKTGRSWRRLFGDH